MVIISLKQEIIVNKLRKGDNYWTYVLHSNSSSLFTPSGTIADEPNSNKHLKLVNANKLAHSYPCICEDYICTASSCRHSIKENK